MQTRTQFRSISLQPIEDERLPSFFIPDRLFLLNDYVDEQVERKR